MRFLSTIVNTARDFASASSEATSPNTNDTKIRVAEAFCEEGRVAFPPPWATRPTSFERPVTYPLHTEDTLTTNGIRAFEICAKILGYVAGWLMCLFLIVHGDEIVLDIARHF